jgi:hypothetical protein
VEEHSYEIAMRRTQMTSHLEPPTRLQSSIDEPGNYDNIYRQASDAFERLLRQQEKLQMRVSDSEEISDHEAEGAMLYVMSRGR